MKKSSLFFALGAFILCLQWGATSKTGKEKPDINFYGTLIYANGERLEVENIQISGRIRDIVLYRKPSQSSLENKSKNVHAEISLDKTKIDLWQVCQINTMNPLVEYNNRNYVEIQIISSDKRGTAGTYIIEQRRDIICDIVGSGFEKEVSFSSIKSLLIKGDRPQLKQDERRPCVYEQHYTSESVPVSSQESVVGSSDVPVSAVRSDDGDLMVTKTRYLIQELEQDAAKLPDQTQEEKTLRSSIMGSLRDLKDSVFSMFK